MKKLLKKSFVVFVVYLFVLSLSGCETADAKISTEFEGGLFKYIFLGEENEIRIADSHELNFSKSENGQGMIEGKVVPDSEFYDSKHSYQFVNGNTFQITSEIEVQEAGTTAANGDTDYHTMTKTKRTVMRIVDDTYLYYVTNEGAGVARLYKGEKPEGQLFDAEFELRPEVDDDPDNDEEVEKIVFSSDGTCTNIDYYFSSFGDEYVTDTRDYGFYTREGDLIYLSGPDVNQIGLLTEDGLVIRPYMRVDE